MPEPPSDDEDTRVEQVEFMGEAKSLAAYFVSQLEDFIDSSVPWLFECIDWSAVQRKMEAGKYRYICEQGAIYRVGLKAAPKAPPGDDPPGPAMPTRGC